jgi:hypothetical protein
MLLAVALALVIALPAGAGKPDKPPKPPKPPTSVPIAVSINAHPMWVHEGDDLIVYAVTLENKTNTDIEDVGVMFITSDPNPLVYKDLITEWDAMTEVDEGVVPANSHVWMTFYMFADQFVEAAPCLAPIEPEDWPKACALLATAEVLIHNDVSNAYELVTQTQMSTPLYPDPPCNFEEPITPGEVSGEVTGGEVCIWVPPETGEWTVSAVPRPNPTPTRPTRVMMTMRDGVPGNWCTLDDGSGGIVQDRLTKTSTSVDLNVFLPGDNGVLDNGMCLTGGHGVCTEDDCYFAVGNPKSFYLYSSFDATVTLTHHPSSD